VTQKECGCVAGLDLTARGNPRLGDIIWAKPNPMPESVTDRPTKSHEYVFLLSKNARYFFDQEAVREANEPRWADSHYKYMDGNIDNYKDGKRDRRQRR
jgi:DNA modification methylase